MNDICTLFPTWASYGKAFSLSLVSADYNIDFPEYANLISKLKKADTLIVEALLAKGYNPQEGLDTFIYACVDGPRYLKDAVEIGVVGDLIRLFVNHGATVRNVPTDRLFSIEYSGLKSIEDESAFIAAKGLMIDELSKYDMDVSRYGDWTTVNATYWEDISLDVDYTTQFRMYLKYCSHYLQSL